MIISNFVAYVKQAWKNKPDTSTPLSAERLQHQEEGIKGNSDAIEKIAEAVVSQIVNDPNKIASMAALYAVNQKIGDVANLPNEAADVVTAITQQNSNFETLNGKFDFGSVVKFKLETISNKQLILIFMVSDVALFRLHFTETQIAFQYYDGENWSYIWAK